MSFLYAHPIEDRVKTSIYEELKKIEEKHQVHIIYACESGSRGWGFASPDSDYDVRFIYVHQLPWYLNVDAQRDVIELPIDDELDISGWELRKALQLFRRSNPTLFEWLNSPIVYREDECTTQKLRSLAANFYHTTKGQWHYLNMAKNNFRGYLKGEQIRLKKYLYVLRPILAVQWINAGYGIPPMRFADLAGKMVTDTTLKEEINALLQIKMTSGEAEYGTPYPRIQAFIENFFETHDIADPDANDRQFGDLDQLNALLYDAVMKFTDKKLLKQHLPNK